jgi:hypothetical protein
MVPDICPPLADHIPIITILDLPLPHATAIKALDFRAADWMVITSTLTVQLEAESPAMCIKSKEEFHRKSAQWFTSPQKY